MKNLVTITHRHVEDLIRALACERAKVEFINAAVSPDTIAKEDGLSGARIIVGVNRRLRKHFRRIVQSVIVQMPH